MQKITFIFNLIFEILWRHCKLAIAWPPPSKSQYQFVGNFDALAFKKSTSLLTSFLRHSKEIVKLFWALWACLTTQTWNDSINLKKPLAFICRQKINFTLHVFFEVLQGSCKLVILDSLGMPGYTTPKVILSTCRKLPGLPASKNSTSSFTFSLWYCKDITTC